MAKKTKRPEKPQSRAKEEKTSKERALENALVTLEGNESRYQFIVSDAVREVRRMLRSRLLKKEGFQHSAMEEIETTVKRVVVLLTGLLELGMAQEEEIAAIKKDDEIFPFLRKKLLFKDFAEILKADAKRQKYIEMSKQLKGWNTLNEFRADPTGHTNAPESCREYVHAYRHELAKIRAYMKLAELVDTNASIKDRTVFISVIKETGKQYLNLRNVFSFIFLMSQTNMAKEEKWTIDDFVELKKRCSRSVDELRSDVETTLKAMIPDEKMRNIIMSFPELKSYVSRAHKVATTGTLRVFCSFFEANPEAKEYATELGRIIILIGDWQWSRRDELEKQRIQEHQSLYLSRVSRGVSRLINERFLDMINEYPYIVKFISREQIVRYMVSESDEDKRATVLRILGEKSQAKLFEILDRKMSVREFLQSFLAEDQSLISLKVVTDGIRMKNKPTHKPMTAVRRARSYMMVLAREATEEAVLKFVNEFKDSTHPPMRLLPESYSAYLWYYLEKKGLKKFIPNVNTEDIKVPQYITYVEEADIKRYLEIRAKTTETRENRGIHIPASHYVV